MISSKIDSFADELINSYEWAYEIVKKEVDNIIDNKITDIDYIERTLDYCLGIYTEKGFYLFLKLVFYYSSVDMEKSYVYINLLREGRKEEYDEYVKKLKK